MSAMHRIELDLAANDDEEPVWIDLFAHILINRLERLLAAYAAFHAWEQLT